MCRPNVTMTDTTSINGDLTARVVVDTTRMPWTPSPSGTVWRKRVHLVGPAEAGQVTSIVRYEPDSTFHAHDHPDGEEILVLDGVFSDEHGDWPAGTYLLNPQGFRHAPFSRHGSSRAAIARMSSSRSTVSSGNRVLFPVSRARRSTLKTASATPFASSAGMPERSSATCAIPTAPSCSSSKGRSRTRTVVTAAVHGSVFP